MTLQVLCAVAGVAVLAVVALTAVLVAQNTGVADLASPGRWDY